MRLNLTTLRRIFTRAVCQSKLNCIRNPALAGVCHTRRNERTAHVEKVIIGKLLHEELSDKNDFLLFCMNERFKRARR